MKKIIFIILCLPFLTHAQVASDSAIAEINQSFPEIVFDKWNKVSMGIMPSDTLSYSSAVSKNGVTTWTNNTKSMRAYVNPNNSFEIDIVLNSIPDSNIFNFNLDNFADLDFLYQPPLWQEEGLGAPTKDCTDTDCNDSHRPENVVGSYAVYSHSLKNGQYQTGKVFHIYRPLVTDSAGNKIWATLSYEKGILTVTVPQTFLETAVYPVIIDPTIGYTTIGGSTSNSSRSISNGLYTPTENGTVNSVSVYITPNLSSNAVVGIYNDNGSGTNPSTLMAQSSSFADPSTNWYTATVSGSLTSGSGIWPVVFGDSTITYSYDTNASYTVKLGAQSTGFPTLDSSWSTNTTSTGRRVSIYVTYTASGGGGSTPPPVYPQFMIF